MLPEIFYSCQDKEKYLKKITLQYLFAIEKNSQTFIYIYYVRIQIRQERNLKSHNRMTYDY